MRTESLGFLKRLIETPSVSGTEQAAQTLCAEYLKPYVDEFHRDAMGNQVAVRNPGAGPRVLLDAHIDEVGLMVRHINEKGFIRFAVIGGVNAAVLAAQRVRIHSAKGMVAGVIGQVPPHLTDPAERDAAPKTENMWIDIAAKNKKDAEKRVAIGDPVTIDVEWMDMGNGCAAGRGFDDRVGAFAVVEAMRLLAKRKVTCSVYGATVVQEEVGKRGATTNAHRVDPQVALAAEFGWTTDHPGIDAARFGRRSLGKGTLISRGPNINPVVQRQLVATAKKHRLPFQVVAEPGATPTDADVIQLARAGVATGLVRVPGRYLHSPVEVLSIRDIELTVKLIVEWVCSLRPGMDFIP